MGDIEYLSIKEFDGKTVKDNGVLASGVTGDIATLTASGGKDMYLAVAEGSVINAGTVLGTNRIELLINGSIVETININVDTDNIPTVTFRFKFSGKVTTGQIIKIARPAAGSQSVVNASLECFEEDTGASPAI